MPVKEVIDLFNITPEQMAHYLWSDCVYGLPDEECEYIHCSLTPEQIRAFGSFLLAKADEMEAPPTSDIYGYDLI